MQLKGAGLQLDNYLAKPEYTARPLPYEWAIARLLPGQAGAAPAPAADRLAGLVAKICTAVFLKDYSPSSW